MFWKWILDNLFTSIFPLGIGIILTLLYGYLKRRCWQTKFKAIFGNDVTTPNNFHLVYGEFVLNPQISQFLASSNITHPYQKPLNNSHIFSISNPISIAEVRAANYLSSIIGAQAKNAPLLSSDIKIKDTLDLSFISLGGPGGNHKTNDILINESNQLAGFNDSQMTLRKLSKFVVTTKNLTTDFNYGLILKINPQQFPNRIWIMCAGFNEWGTSGAAYYLANKWEQIYKWAKGSSFAIIVKVRNGQDESTEEYQKIKVPEE